MNIQDYKWQTFQDGDKVIARPVNPFEDEREWYDFEKYARCQTYETLNLPACQIIEGKELELVDVYSWSNLNEVINKLKLRPKTQPIEGEKETLNGHYHIIEAIVQKTLEYVAEHLDGPYAYSETLKDAQTNVLAMREDILKEIYR